MSDQIDKPATGTKPKRPVGRPRADGRAQLSREEVLLTAARLIARNGFAGTSIRMIAGALDAAPASIFNLFASKDDLLNELIEVAATPSLAFYEKLRQLPLAPAVALYKSVFEETLVVASAPWEIPALFYLPELAKPGYERAQAVRAQMVAHYRTLIEQGQAEGSLIGLPAALAAEQLFQLTETSILAGADARALPPAERASTTARLCMRALLAEPAQLETVEAEATAVDLRIALPGHLTGDAAKR
ncbi:MAG: TetR/AcrR family transcriptional regulator [Parvibaculaceae bacterium]